MKIKVVLMKSFEFDVTELTGTTVEEKTTIAVTLARDKFYKLFSTRAAKPIVEDSVLILTKDTKCN